MSQKKITITTDYGEPKEALSPLIISSSRSTDIPAFYGNWFMRRLDAGYIRWVNPWNGRSTYVSLRDARLFVFWTKNPEPFLPCIEELERRNIHSYFHYTLNDYEAEGLEKGVPPLGERIETFRRLASLLGRQRVLWRFDPLLLTAALSPEKLLSRIERIGNALSDCTERLTVSFVTMYAAVARRLWRDGVTLMDWDAASRETIMAGVGALVRKWRIQGVTSRRQKITRNSGLYRANA